MPPTGLEAEPARRRSHGCLCGTRRRPETIAGLLIALVALAPEARGDVVGVHAEVDAEGARMVFAWPQPVGHKATFGKGRLTVRFDRPIEADLGGLAALGRWLDEPRIDASGHVLSVRLAPRVTALAYQDGANVVVDLLGPPRPLAAAAGPTAPARQEGNAAVATTTGPRSDPRSDLRSDPVPDPGVDPGFDLPGRRRRPPLARPPQPQPTDGPAPAGGAVDDRPARQPSPSSPAPSPSAPPPPPPARRAPASAAAAAEARLGFAWNAPTAAALVRRGETHWLAFDRPSTPDLGALEAAAKGAVQSIIAHPDPAATVLALRLKDGVQPRLVAEGGGWTLVLTTDAAARVQPIPLNAAKAPPPNQGQQSILLSAAVGNAAVRVPDGDAGRSLVIVPVHQAGAGMAEEQILPEVRLLETVQGLAIEPRADGLRIGLGDDFVEIARPGGLGLGALPDPMRPAGAGAAGGPAGLLFPEPLDAAAEDRFIHRRSALERAAAEGSGAGREEARLALCTLLLERGLATECLGLVALIGEDRPAARGERRVRFLRGAASLLTGRLANARTDLSDAARAGTDEGGLWLAALAALEDSGSDGPPVGAVGRWLPILEAYPQPVRFALARPLAEATLAKGSVADAKRLTDALAGWAVTARERAWLPYLRGSLLARQGKRDKAIAAWAETKLDPSHPAYARTRFARINLELENNALDPRRALADLEPLRDQWRGDPFEFKVLRRLGRLQIEAGDHADGLRTLDAAARRFKARPDAAELAREVAASFERLAVGDLADRLTPLQAIALIRDFGTLIPAGDKRRALVRRHVERLIAVDLLADAATVLEHEVASAPPDPERAADGLRLAEVYTRDGRPEAALAALERSAAGPMPAGLVRARDRLEARARAALGQGDAALALLKDENDPDSLRLRTRILRDREDWAGTGASLDRELARPQDAAGPSAPSPETVLDLAAALTLARESDAARRLRADRGHELATTPLADAFKVLTGGLPPPGADADALKAYVAEAEAVRQLMGQ